MTLTLKNIPEDLHARLKLLAQRHRRSLNQEAICCLEAAMDLSAPTPSHDPLRSAWLRQGEATLQKAWDNPDDEVFNELLTK